MACRTAFDALTEDAGQLLNAGDTGIYTRRREALISEVRSAEVNSRAKALRIESYAIFNNFAESFYGALSQIVNLSTRLVGRNMSVSADEISKQILQ